jgi:hypothetical protein
MQSKAERVFRIGTISANVFLNKLEGPQGDTELRSVEVRKAFREGDEWKFTYALNLSDLPNAIRALQLAQQYIEPLEAEVLDDSDG